MGKGTTLKLFFGKKSAPKPVDTVNLAIRSGVGVARHRISKAQAAEIRAAEATGGQAAGLAALLRILRAPRPEDR